jgi:hypothetical protein
MIELNAELIAEYLWQRELYMEAHIMIRRQGDRGNDEAGETRTYLGAALIGRAEDNRGQVFVTGSTAVPEVPRLPASSPWSGGDPCGTEPPLGFSIDEVGAALGGAGRSAIAGENRSDEPAAPLRCVEFSTPQVSSGQESDANGWKR